jgi:hypothetical protein
MMATQSETSTLRLSGGPFTIATQVVLPNFALVDYGGCTINCAVPPIDGVQFLGGRRPNNGVVSAANAIETTVSRPA